MSHCINHSTVFYAYDIKKAMLVALTSNVCLILLGFVSNMLSNKLQRKLIDIVPNSLKREQ